MAGYNLQLVALGGYFAIRAGPWSRRFKADPILQTRCTKMTNTHLLASVGKANLPGGITNGKNETILPIPPNAYKLAVEQTQARCVQNHHSILHTL